MMKTYCAMIQGHNMTPLVSMYQFIAQMITNVDIPEVYGELM